MTKYTNSKTFKFSDVQINSLNKLSNYGVNVSKFVRLAVAEKIKRDWPSIKEKKEKEKTPF